MAGEILPQFLRPTQSKANSQNQDGRPLSDERLKLLNDSMGSRGSEAVSGQVGERLASLRKAAYDGQAAIV